MNPAEEISMYFFPPGVSFNLRDILLARPCVQENFLFPD